MKKTMSRLMSLLLSVALLLSAVVTSAASSTSENESIATASTENAGDYTDLYVTDADGDGESDLTLLWDAFDQKAGDVLSEDAFTVDASASYGDGYLYNNFTQFDLTDYLPNFTYGTQTAQKDYTVELAMSTCAPVESGTSFTKRPGSANAWYFGNFTGNFYFRQSEHTDYLAGNGPISVYVGSFGSTSLNFNFNKSKTNFLFGTTPLESYTSTLSFDLTLGETPDAEKDTIQMSFYRDAQKLSISTTVDNPIAYDASNTNDKLTFGLGCGLNYYAIRVYSSVLTEAQMRQNHFADLMGYFGISADAYLALSEDARATVILEASDIALTDQDGKERLASIIEDACRKSLYVTDADGDGVSDLTLRWDAFGKTAEDTVSESAFTVAANAQYGNGYLYNDAAEINLTSYLPNITYGTETAQKDYSVELVMSTHAPYESGTGMSVSGKQWFFGNFMAAFYFRQSEHTDYLAGNGPISVYVGSLGSTSLNFNFNKGKTNLLLGTTPLESYTSTLCFDLTLGETPDATKDTIQMSFYNNAKKFSVKTVVDNPVAYDAANTNDKLTVGLGMRLNYYAIRVYSSVLTEAQMRQNHFADLVNYFDLSLDQYLALSEDARAAVIEEASSINLTDENAEETLTELIDQAYFTTLYVDGATLRWDAFDKKAGDALSEDAFTVDASASYGDGYLYNNFTALNLTDYLPNFTYGTQTAQKDYTVELAMSTCAPVESGTSFTKRPGLANAWYFGNFTGNFYFRQSEHTDYLAGNGPISVYVGSFGSTSLNFNFNKGKTNFLFGTTPLESYTSTLTFDLTLGETPDTTKDTIQMGFYRDAQKLSISTTVDNPIAYDASNTNDKLTFGLGCGLNFYAIRVYPFVLTEAQMRQNHFADLVNFANIDNLSAFSKLPEQSKQALYEQFAEVKLTDGRASVKASLEMAITRAYRESIGESSIMAEDFVTFLGYQVRLFGDAPGLRSLFCLNENEVEGAVLHEIGAIMAVGEGYELTDLTPENAATGARMIATKVYADGAFDKAHIFTNTVDGEEKNCFAYTLLYDTDFAKNQYSTEILYRAYVKVEIDGAILTLYTDMTTSLDSVSLLSVTRAVVERNEALADNALVKCVLESELNNIENKLTAYEQTVSDAETARLDATEQVLTARTRAVELKEALKLIATEGNGASDEEKQELIAEIAVLLAEHDEIKAQAQTSFPSMGDELASIVSDAAEMDKLVALVDENSALRTRIATLSAAAQAEQEAQAAGFSKDTLWKKTDALDALSVAKTVGDRMTAGDFSEVKTLKVLAIGNSFSNNAMSQLFTIAKSFGYEDIVLGNLYIGGCSLAQHASNAKNSTAAYTYRKATSATWREYAESTSLRGLTDEDWDIITVQQVSHLAPQASTLTDGNLDDLINFVNQNKTNPNAKIYYHATWSYAVGHTHSSAGKDGYEYLNDQAQMDALIAASVEEVILKRDDIDGVIYTGVAVAKAREYFGNEFELYTSPDGYHLNAKGCYIIGLTWFGTLTGEDITNATATSTSGLSGDDLTAAIAAAQAGLDAIQ